MKKTRVEIEQELEQFIGSEHFYKHILGITLTDGAKFIAEECGAYWLMDIIASYQQKLRNEEFQTWTLTVDIEKSKGMVTCDDGNGNILAKQKIPFTDFPLDLIKFYCCNNVIMLPSEY